ncbi:hypothetical protein GCM10027572_21770 [Flexivirga lutea]
MGDDMAATCGTDLEDADANNSDRHPASRSTKKVRTVRRGGWCSRVRRLLMGGSACVEREVARFDPRYGRPVS